MDFEQLKAELAKRDENDRMREIAPLKKAEDAVLVDTTDCPVSEVVEKILQLCRNKLNDEE